MLRISSKMERCLIILSLAAIAIASSSPEKLTAKQSPGRIVGGVEAPIEKFPYQVAILTPYGDFGCGGSIIGNHYVLTAGHCSWFSKNGYIRVGSNTTGSGGTLHHVTEVTSYENSGYYDGDIAILKVIPDFVFGKSVAPIKIYEEKYGNGIADGEMVTVTGYGTDSFHGKLTETLQAVEVPIFNRAKCNEVYTHLGGVTEDRICAGFTEGGKDSCQGDSGGPAVYNGYLVGIVSYGEDCAKPNLPGVYVNVSHYADWTKKHVIEEEDSRAKPLDLLKFLTKLGEESSNLL